MTSIPKFKLYGEDDPTFAERIQSKLPLRPWSNLAVEDKENMFQSLWTSMWFKENEHGLIYSLKQLNYRFRRRLPAKSISKFSNLTTLDSPAFCKAAISDFRKIFVHDGSEELVLYMVSLFADDLIDKNSLEVAQSCEDIDKRRYWVADAFRNFDAFASQLNHLFEQFSVNIVISRCGMIPRQDDRITKEVYLPTLEVLSDIKWQSVNSILIEMFKDYQEQRYPEVIAKSHNALHQFLKVALGDEGYSGKGEFGKLFKDAKSKNVISNSDEIDPFVNGLKSVIASQRVKKSTAKPTDQEASSADALLVINCCMVLIQHCLQNV